ncbi:MAG: type IV pilus twitching motility protein PilT [Vulcanimicrobiaceae bacterium]
MSYHELAHVTPSPGRIFALLERGRERQASDLHIEPGQGAAFRVFTNVERIDDSFIEYGEIGAFLDATVDRLSRARLDKIGIADAVYADERVGSIRIHASRGKHGARLAIRLLARSIPALEELVLPDVVESFTALKSGLVLVAGPTGSGKSTTIASLLDRINATSSKHIVTFEDPIEYQHLWLKSVVTQYEVGRDVASFPEGVRGALRADPDVLFIGELRGVETVSACLQAAETGHLVFAALHTPSETPQAINRIVGLFPSDEQENARTRLAESLRALVGLRLLPLSDGRGLRAAVEIMIANDAVRRLIRDGATHQLRSVIASSRRDGMQTLEAHLSELVVGGEVDIAVARAASSYPDDVKESVLSPVRRR